MVRPRPVLGIKQGRRETLDPVVAYSQDQEHHGKPRTLRDGGKHAPDRRPRMIRSPETHMMLIKRIIVCFFRKLGYEIVKTKKPEKDDTHEAQDMELPCGEIKKIHYGCGPKYLEGWVNVDLNAQDRPTYFSVSADLTKRHPFSKDQFEFGFAEDFIEHLGQAEQILFLYEVYRTLKKGGVLRLSFPGLEGVLRKHFPDSTYKTATLAKKEAYEMWGHTHFPSFCELEMICKTIGFREVNRVGYGTSAYKELKNIDTREDQIGLNTYVEIIK